MHEMGGQGKREGGGVGRKNVRRIGGGERGEGGNILCQT